MNRSLARCVVASLGVTGPTDECLASLGTFRRRDWQRTLPWLDDSGLALYLLERIERTGPRPVLPAEIDAHLRRNLASNRRRLAAMREEFGSLNRRFEAAGVKYAVLKGFALIPDYCPDAALRSQYDYDYLVHPGSLEIAQRALQSAGYSRKVRNPEFDKMGEFFFSAQPLSVPPPKEDFYSANLPRDVELHLSLWEPNGEMIDVEAPNDALDRSRPAEWEGLRFPVLADDDTLIFEALHAFQHILAFWCKPSFFFEVAYFIAQRYSDEVFWERFRSRLQRHRYLPRIVGLVFSMAAMLFRAPVPAEVSKWTTGALPATLSGWVERYGKHWALARFPGSKLSLFVHREFIENPEVWREVRRSRLFPFHRPAQVAEPAGPGLTSKWAASWGQAYFVLSRLRFHLKAWLSYAWEQRRWKRGLQRLQRGDI
jgi:hypothetical protein